MSRRTRTSLVILLSLLLGLFVSACAERKSAPTREVEPFRRGELSVGVPRQPAATVVVESEKSAEALPAFEGKTAPGVAGGAPPQESPGGGDLVAPFDRKIVKNATLRLETEDVFGALNAVTLLTNQYGGYVLSSRTWYENERPRALYAFAVPAERFEEALEQVRQLGKVLDETTSGQDVTDQYVDLEARIRNLEATANRIRSFLDEARTVEEALRVNEQLRYVEEELERLKARRNALEQRTAYSTITVEFVPPLLKPEEKKPSTWSPRTTFEEAWRVLMAILQRTVDVAIWVAVLGSPLLVVLVPIWLVGRRMLAQGQRPNMPS